MSPAGASRSLTPVSVGIAALVVLADQLSKRWAVSSLSDGHAVLAIALVGQCGSPELLTGSEEARVIEHCIRIKQLKYLVTERQLLHDLSWASSAQPA